VKFEVVLMGHSIPQKQVISLGTFLSKMVEFDESEGEPSISPDTPNQTKFHPEEAPEEQRGYYQRLVGYNRGTRTGRGSDQRLLREQEKLARFDAIAGRLELPPYQRGLARVMMKNLDLRRLGYSTELVAFCLCASLARKDGRMYHPSRSDNNNDPVFLEVAESLKPREQRIVINCLHKLWSLHPELRSFDSNR
jgi:hypothetical protein